MNVKSVMQHTVNWRNVGEQLLVPKAILERIGGRYYGRRQRKIDVLACYVVSTLPALTWKGIVGAFHYCDELVQVHRDIPIGEWVCLHNYVYNWARGSKPMHVPIASAAPKPP